MKKNLFFALAAVFFLSYINANEKDVLIELGNKYKPTKMAHNYLPLYSKYFTENRFKVKKVLEIGVQTKRSVAMWRDFFPNAVIYEIDIDPRCEQYEEERIKILIGSQGDENFLTSLPNDFDIIIDDGSHIPQHQILSFKVLFPKMRSTGIYVIEDIINNQTTANFIKGMIDNINYWPKNFSTRNWPKLLHFPKEASYWDKHILGIAFYRYIAFIFKGNNPEDGASALRQE